MIPYYIFSIQPIFSRYIDKQFIITSATKHFLTKDASSHYTKILGLFVNTEAMPNLVFFLFSRNKK